jgi:DeoR/GlpR family transcriptional regulator of sugar metabolism
MAHLPSALPDERQQIILDRLARTGRVLAADLARDLGTSEDTVRRDLRELAAAGLCRRVYGGALPLSPASGTLAEREAESPERKAALGERTARLVQALMRPGQVLFLDAGSTNHAVARALPPGLGLTVVTNTPAIASTLLGKPGIEVLVIGGRLNARVGAAIGGRALRDAREIRADLVILGACAVSAQTGVATFDSDDAELKRVVAEAAAAVALAVTTDKLGTTAPYAVIPIAAVTHLVVEADATEAMLAPLMHGGIRIHRTAAATGERT